MSGVHINAKVCYDQKVYEAKYKLEDKNLFIESVKDNFTETTELSKRAKKRANKKRNRSEKQMLNTLKIENGLNIHIYIYVYYNIEIYTSIYIYIHYIYIYIYIYLNKLMNE